MTHYTKEELVELQDKAARIEAALQNSDSHPTPELGAVRELATALRILGDRDLALRELFEVQGESNEFYVNGFPDQYAQLEESYDVEFAQKLRTIMGSDAVANDEEYAKLDALTPGSVLRDADGDLYAMLSPRYGESPSVWQSLGRTITFTVRDIKLPVTMLESR